MPPDTIIHVGYPKSGSSTIQHNFFSRISEAVYVSRKGNAGDPGYWDLYELISRAIMHDSNVEEAASNWKELAERHADRKLLIFSDERMTFPPQLQRRLLLMERPYVVLKIFGNAKIILVLRQPVEFLRSLYQYRCIKQFQKKADPPAFRDWIDEDLLAEKYDRGALSQALHFGELAIRYAEFFGKQNVGIFFLEDLQHKPEKFFGELGAFMGNVDLPQDLASNLEIRNITAQNQHVEEIGDVVPDFHQPCFPAHISRQIEIITAEQSSYLYEYFGLNTALRWPS